jgi:hypothetical protein
MMTLNTRELLQKIQHLRNKNYKNSKVTIVTMETRPLRALKYHNKNIQEYSAKYGYSYIFLDHYENKLELPIYWKKIQLLQEQLTKVKPNEYVMWMDSDTMVCHDIPLDALFEEGNSKSIFIGKDFPYGPYNAGVFIVKNNERGRGFIDDCINEYLSRKECRNEKGDLILGKEWSGSCYEQGIMNTLLMTDYKNDVHTIDHTFLINTNMPMTSTVILHLFDGNYTKDASVRDKFLYDQFKMIDEKHEILPSRLKQLLHFLYIIFYL